MIPKELDDLIKEYLTDGIISQTERQVLLRKAEKMGLDIDEIDLYITAQEQKIDNKIAAEKKAAIGKVCPKCGRQVESMTLRCECGYEFKNEKAVSSVQKFHDELQKVSYSKKSEMILTFPVPNTKEDIIEFLALAAPRSKPKGSKYWRTKAGRRLCSFVAFLVILVIDVILIKFFDESCSDYEEFKKTFAASLYIVVFFALVIAYIICNADEDIIDYNKEAEVWRDKFDQVLMKGRSLRGDVEFQQQLDYYENVLNEM